MRHPIWLAILPTLAITCALGSVCLLTVFAGQRMMQPDEAWAWLLALTVAVTAFGLTALVGARRLLAPAFDWLSPHPSVHADAQRAFRSLNNFPGRYAGLMAGAIALLATLVTLAPLAVGGRVRELGPFLLCYNLAGSGIFALVLFGRLPRVLQPIAEGVAAACGERPLDDPGLTSTKPTRTWRFLMLGAVVLMLLYGVMGWLSGQGALFALVQAEVVGIVVWVSYDATVAQARPAALLRQGLQALSDEHFDHRVPVSTNDDSGMIAQSLNGLGRHLGHVMTRIRTGVQQASEANVAQARFASDSLDQVSQAVQEQAIGSSRIADLADGMQRRIQTMAAAITNIAQYAEAMDRQTDETRSGVLAGTRQVSETLGHLATVRTRVQETADAMTALDQQSQQISAITALIAGIARQTNLLALNAAIEAARAGEHGRGFSVVADEVRHLSQSAQEAVSDISRRVQAMQTMTAQTITGMQALSGQVDTFNEMAQGTDTVLQRIATVATSEHDRIHGISDAITELVRQSGQVEQGMAEVAAIVQQSAAASEEITATTHEVATALAQVSDMASRLQQMVTDLGRLDQGNETTATGWPARLPEGRSEGYGSGAKAAPAF